MNDDDDGDVDGEAADDNDVGVPPSNSTTATAPPSSPASVTTKSVNGRGILGAMRFAFVTCAVTRFALHALISFSAHFKKCTDA